MPDRKITIAIASTLVALAILVILLVTLGGYGSSTGAKSKHQLIATVISAKIRAHLPYGWPLKPFSEQHPIRGSFDDPRISTKHINSPRLGGESFHSGVDIVAAGGTPVYAVEGGVVGIMTHHHLAVVVVSGKIKRRLAFGYWHLSIVVRNNQLVHKHQLLGYVLSRYGHVHFSEKLHGRYVNPLLKGRLTPFHYPIPPTIVSLSSFQEGRYHNLDYARVSGIVDLVVNAFDKPPIRTPWPRDVLTPSLIRWKLVNSSDKTVVPATTVINFDRYYTAPLTSVYAPWTVQNGPKQKGNYDFWLVKDFNTSCFVNGAYTLTVIVSNVRNYTSVRSFRFEISNPETNTSRSSCRARPRFLLNTR